VQNDEGPHLIRIPNGNLASGPRNEHEIVQLRPVYEQPPPNRTHPPNSVIHSPEKVRDHATEANRPGHQSNGSLDMVSLHQNTVLPSIEGPQFTSSPRSLSNGRKELKHSFIPSPERDHVMRPMASNSDVRRVGGTPRIDFSEALELREPHPPKRRRLLPDRSLAELYPSEIRSNIHDEHSKASIVVGRPLDDGRPLLIRKLPADRKLENSVSIPPKDHRIVVRRQPELGPPIGLPSRSQISLRALQEQLPSHSSELSRQNSHHPGAHVLANRSNLPYSSPDLHVNPFSNYSSVDEHYPLVVRNDEHFVRPVHFREIIRPLSEVTDRERVLHISKCTNPAPRIHDPGIEGHRHVPCPNENRVSGRHIRYIPVSSRGSDRFDSEQDTRMATTYQADSIKAPQRNIPATDAVRQGSSFGGPFRTVVSNLMSQPHARRSYSPDRRVYASFRAPIAENVSAFPILRRPLQTHDRPPAEQPPLPRRSERETCRDVPIATQYACANRNLIRRKVVLCETANYMLRNPNNREPLLRRVQYEDRDSSSLPSASAGYRHAVPTRGEVVVLE
jgi:hypothetical protein